MLYQRGLYAKGPNTLWFWLKFILNNFSKVLKFNFIFTSTQNTKGTRTFILVFHDYFFLNSISPWNFSFILC